MPDIIITLTALQATRLANAFGNRQGLGVPATLLQIKTYLIDLLKDIVRQEEKAVQEAAIVVSPFDPT